MRSTEQLHGDLLTLLGSVTRDRYSYTGNASQRVRVNPNGIDLHDGKVGSVALTTDGTAHPYMALYVQPRVDRHERAAGGASAGTFGFRLTVAAGAPDQVRWAHEKIAQALGRARLHSSTGLLTPYFDINEVLEDPDAKPTRWYLPLRYSTSVH